MGGDMSPAPTAETKKPRMLVVDDEAENTDFLRRLFRADFVVQVAASGDEALGLLSKENFDVIITDQMMPGMTGVELLSRAVALAPEAVRILVTGFPDLDAAVSSVNEGRAFRFLTKPLDRKELRDVVSAAFQGMNSHQILRDRVERLEQENRALRVQLGETDVQVPIRGIAEPARAGLALDGETGLLTREVLVDRLEAEVARSERFGLLCSFILFRANDFRALQDENPERAKRVVERIAWLMRLRSRRYDLAARWSEDAFAILLPHVGKAGAEARIARIQQMVDGSTENRDILNLSFQSASYPETETTVSGLMDAVLAPLGLR